MDTIDPRYEGPTAVASAVASLVPELSSVITGYLDKGYGSVSAIAGGVPEADAATLAYWGATASFLSESSETSILEYIEPGFLDRGYGIFSSPETLNPAVETSDRSVKELWLGPANRPRMDDFSTPSPTTGSDDMLLGASISSISSSQTMYLGTFEDKT